jgi:RNA polymerase sigma factor (sigma-70 family)
MPNKKPWLVDNEDEIWIRCYCKTGNTFYWGKLYEKYKRQIFLRCVKLLHDKEDASDLTNETFIKAFENIEKYDLKRPFAPWLMQIANNLCIDLLRRKTLIQFNPMKVNRNAKSADDISKRIENMELGEKILQAIRSLKGNQRRCFCLFYIHRKSYKEIAELTGYSYNDIRSYIQNGRRKFKLAMQG